MINQTYTCIKELIPNLNPAVRSPEATAAEYCRDFEHQERPFAQGAFQRHGKPEDTEFNYNGICWVAENGQLTGIKRRNP